MSIEYISGVSDMTPGVLSGFFGGWPTPPTPAEHLGILRGSSRVWLARDTDADRIVGFITCITDGHLSAYIPLLEVLPEYRGHGIGSALVSRMMDEVGHLYMVDLVCDVEMAGFYERFGFQCYNAMIRRNRGGAGR